jgi:hypothetical protein
MRDLAPYICVFENCNKPQHQFQTSNAWITHIMREHMPVEWTCFMHKSGSILSSTDKHVFRSEDDYIQHMYQNHGETLAEKQLPTLAQLSQRATTDVFKMCQFCGGFPEDDPKILESKEDPDKLQHALQKHVRTHLQSLAMISLPWDSSQPETSASSNEVQGDYENRKNKKRPSEESDGGSDSGSDHKPVFIDPPPSISDDVGHDLIDYMKLESRAPSEPYEPYSINLSSAIPVNPGWETSQTLTGGREWEFIEDKRPLYNGHSSNPRMATFIRAWQKRLAMENEATTCSHIHKQMADDFRKMSAHDWFSLSYCKELLENKDIETVLKVAKENYPEWKSTISDLTAFVYDHAPQLFTMLIFHRSEKMLDQFCDQGMDDSMFPVNLVQSEDSIESTNKYKPKILRLDNILFASDVCDWQWKFLFLNCVGRLSTLLPLTPGANCHF